MIRCPEVGDPCAKERPLLGKASPAVRSQVNKDARQGLKWSTVSFDLVPETRSRIEPYGALADRRGTAMVNEGESYRLHWLGLRSQGFFFEKD